MSHITTARSFRELMEEVRSGSQDAAWELVDLYGPHVQRFVRRALHRQLRSKFDSIDFVQIVWASVFREPEKLRNIQQSEELIALLAGIARHKVLNEVRRRLQSLKYNIGRERPMGFREEEDGELHLRNPTPSAVAIAKERWDLMIAKENPMVQSVVTLRLQGVTFVEIANRLQIHERTARKVIERLTGDSDTATGTE
jgi:RNA polymerase sigma-70 factor (ECF subfamily)